MTEQKNTPTLFERLYSRWQEYRQPDWLQLFEKIGMQAVCQSFVVGTFGGAMKSELLLKGAIVVFAVGFVVNGTTSMILQHRKNQSTDFEEDSYAEADLNPSQRFALQGNSL